MIRVLRITAVWLAGLMVTLAMAPGLGAQSFWREPTPGKSLSVEVSWPKYPSRSFPHIRYPWPSTSAIMLGFRYPVAGPILLAAELPFAHVSGRHPTTTAGSVSFVHGTILGNPYVGGEVDPWGGIAVLRLGMRLPLQKADHHETRDRYDNVAAAVGYTSHRVDRLEAFLPKLTSGMAEVVMGMDFTPRFRVHTLAGLSLLSFADDADYLRDQDHTQLHLRLGAEGLWRVGRATVGAGLLARDRLTGVDRREDHRSYEWSAKVDYRFRSWTVGLALRLPAFPGYGPGMEWRVITLLLEWAL